MSIPTSTKQYILYKRESIQDLEVNEGKIPSLKGTDVLLKVHAVSLNYRDLLIAISRYPLPLKDLPLVPGSDMAGEVIQVGPEVTKWKVGDKVCPNFTLEHLYGDVNRQILGSSLGGGVDGVLTQYKVAAEKSLVAIPEGWSYEEASTLPCAALTAYNALHGPIPVKAGDVVLTQGTGGVSFFGLQFAVAAGATVIATSSSDEKLKIAAKHGAQHVINYRTTPDWEKEVLRITNGRGVDHVIEVGGPGTLTKSFASLRYGGWIHTIGFVASGDDPKNVAGMCLSKGAMLRGILIGSVKQFEDMNRLINANALKPLVDKVFSFDEVHAAYKHLESQQHVGKVVIKVA